MTPAALEEQEDELSSLGAKHWTSPPSPATTISPFPLISPLSSPPLRLLEKQPPHLVNKRHVGEVGGEREHPIGWREAPALLCIKQYFVWERAAQEEVFCWRMMTEGSENCSHTPNQQRPWRKLSPATPLEHRHFKSLWSLSNSRKKSPNKQNS
ncbi:Dna Oxidative Demethylase Alkbh2 [Manis pentadactyla]|nr:Dna Oxidative Demethylase Alkbh2 [Manis pentadactyla]